MLRAVRFAAQLGFSVEPRTRSALERLAPNLSKVSAERIQAELVKLLVSPHPEEIGMAYEAGLTRIFLPEFDRMMETEQHNPHHCYSVGEHTVEALKHAPADRVIRLAVLLHDVAKPECRRTDESGKDHFHGHPARGAEMAEEILRRLKFDKDTIRHVCQLIRWHDDRPELNEREIRRAIHRAGLEQYPALFDVKRADILAQSLYERDEKLAWLAGYEAMYETIRAKQQCISLRDLAVNGKDLIAEGIAPGREMGDMLNRLLELVIDDPSANTKENLLAQVHKWNSPHI
jgi:tRNA nucleotidyltransferase (CCA-adding enzyme)